MALFDDAYMRQLGSMSLTVIIPLFHTLLSWQIHRYSAAEILDTSSSKRSFIFDETPPEVCFKSFQLSTRETYSNVEISLIPENQNMIFQFLICVIAAVAKKYIPFWWSLYQTIKI